MHTFTLEPTEINALVKPDWMANLHSRKKRNTGYNRLKANNVHQLMHILLSGKDVFRHYKPKHRTKYIMAKLSGDKLETHLHPYHAIIKACMEFEWRVPRDVNPHKPGNNWEHAASYIKRMDDLLVPFNKRKSGLFAIRKVSYDTLVNLRPFIVQLRLQATATYKL